jgi:uncharacterized protein (TIGR02466 family)
MPVPPIGVRKGYRKADFDLACGLTLSHAMARIAPLFVTRLYRAQLSGAKGRRLLAEIARSARAIAREDKAGQKWSRENGYAGYTSYSSLNDLAWRDPVIAELVVWLDRHVAVFVNALELDVGRRPLSLDSLWINILDPGGVHSAHIHPRSVVSGTFYVDVPEGASALRLEDPRLPLMMAAPPRKSRAKEPNRSFVTVAPKAGQVLLWESWLRHEVPLNRSRKERISISFNYAW